MRKTSSAAMNDTFSEYVFVITGSVFCGVSDRNIQQDTNQFIGNLVGWILIYIIHKQYRHKIKRLKLSTDTVPSHRVFT